ncbi:unnamed protein product [Paramecium octaurelia]|uniref:B9 domain-containing protein 2 n=1 Tax=Paramecium octaurelia TaxID=43137 RepID=A0A8S1VSV0_PAROT|nr:unnamed protein product [Paramecium octaurelia]
MSMPYQQTGNQIDYQEIKQTKADLKAEVHFIGQIVGGLDFQTDDGLFCELAIDCGDGWDLLQPGNNKGIQTQTSYANPGQLFSWGHPFDLHFSVSNLIGWPKALLKVWRLDSSNKIDACSYGTAIFPRSAGYHQVTCETWTPTGENLDLEIRKPNEDLATNTDSLSKFDRTLDWRFQALSFYMENPPRLTTLAPLTTDKGDFARRKILNSISNGKVIMEVEVVMKNFKRLSFSGQ